MSDKCIIYSTEFSELKVAEKKKILLSEVGSEIDFTEDDAIYYEIAMSFYKLILANVESYPSYTRQAIKINATAIDVIMKMAKDYTVEDFRKMYTWLRDKIFWHNNIRSFTKLREQADRLLSEYNASTNNKSETIQEAVSSMKPFDPSDYDR